MSAKALILFLTCPWYIQDAYNYEFNFKYVNGTDIDNLNEHCKSNDCLVKCCPEKHIMLDFYGHSYHNCTSIFELIEKFGIKGPDNYSEINVYDKNIKHVMKPKKTANQMKFIYDTNFTKYVHYLGNQPDTFLLEDGRFVFYRANYWQPWKPVYEPRQFCIEHEVSLYDNATLVSATPRLVVCTLRGAESSSNARAILSVYGLLVSCVFLSLVLVVYALLPELRNLAGLMLMACMATYLAFFLTRVIHVFLNVHGILTSIKNGCQILIIIFYYLMLATFCWMNVMSFDIWWTFRNLYKYSPKSKLFWYCAYAWGAPALPTLFVVSVELTDLTSVPGFVKLNLWDYMCNIELEAHLLYFSVPVFILICVNVILFLMTTFNIWQVRRGVKKYISQDVNNKSNENRFWVYIRLSLLMGVSWILEVVSNIVEPESLAWCIADFYNSLIGLFIFLMFICKKKIFLSLCVRFSIENKLVRSTRGSADDPRAPGAPSKGLHHSDTGDVDGPSPCGKGITISEDI